MANLEDIQKKVSSFITKNDDTDLSKDILPTGKLSTEEALDVYKQGYYARLTDALGENFEAVWWVLGDESFMDTTKEYIAANPSTFYNINDYHFGFINFLKSHPASREINFLHDLARFEWEFKLIFHARTDTPIDKNSVAAKIHDDCKINFVSSLQLFHAPSAVYSVWKEKKNPDSDNLDIEVDRPQHLIIYKTKALTDVHIYELSKIDFLLFTKLKSGLSLSDSITQASEEIEIKPEDISEFFTSLLDLEIIKEII